jgi:hypothetical protein
MAVSPVTSAFKLLAWMAAKKLIFRPNLCYFAPYEKNWVRQHP